MFVNPSAGPPLSFAILGVSRIETALAFYRDVIGLEASPVATWSGDAFEQHLMLPKGSSAQAVMFSHKSDVGRVLALEFNAKDRIVIPQPGDRTYRGLWNLNFYVNDIRAATRDLLAKGFQFWSEPVGYEVSAKAGMPIEVLFDGPDGLAINLVELTGDENSTIGRLKQEVDQLGKTPTGFTPVATTSHSIVDYTKARAFYTQVIGMEAQIDDVLNKPETNRFLGRPADAQTRATFMAGHHQFGKVALSYPLNYAVPNKVPLAVAPNIGYLAQSFCVAPLTNALTQCEMVGAELFSGPQSLEIPGLGPARAMMVRTPGSGALIQLYEKVAT